MTIRFRSKKSRYRGSGSHGGGHKKKRRGGGSRGGRGYSGRKHKFSYTTTKDLEHYGKKGFYLSRKKPKAINIDDMLRLTAENDINLAELGYDKLLSRGRATRKVIIKAGSYTKKAKEKIDAAGGKITE